MKNLKIKQYFKLCERIFNLEYSRDENKAKQSNKAFAILFHELTILMHQVSING